MCLLPQVYFNKILIAALVAIQFHAVLCLEAQRKGMVITMKTSTEIASAARLIGEHKAIEYYARAGFDAWDFSMFSMFRYNWQTQKIEESNHPLAGSSYLKFARELKQVGLDNGIHCNQSHAPFPITVPGIEVYMKRAIECTAEAGGDICIIHPGNNLSIMENARFYWQLLPFAKEHNVRIATENMWNWNYDLGHSTFAACATGKNFCQHIDTVADPDFVACLDLGHAEMNGSGDGAANMIRTLGHRLQALHIHDNDLLNDSHQLPFSMKIDFTAIVRALKEVGYRGYFTLEADRYLSAYDASNAVIGMQKLVDAAKKLADMFENA